MDGQQGKPFDLDQATQLVSAVHDDPATAYRIALEQLQLDLRSPVRSVVLRAAGLASRLVSTLDESIHYLQEAVAGTQNTELRAEAEISLAGSLLLSGDAEGALRLLGPDGGGTDPDLEARRLFQRATILARSGRVSEAEEGFTRSLRLLRRCGNQVFEANALMNRGRLRLESGGLDGSATDLAQAADLHRHLGNTVSCAYAELNLADLAVRRGDLVEALALIERCGPVLNSLTQMPWEASVIEGQALLSAGLFGEAAAKLGEAAKLMEGAGLQLERAETLLLLAKIHRADGSLDDARQQATRSLNLFREQGRDGWAAQAELVGWQSLPQGEGPEPGSAALALQALAERLGRHGFVLSSHEALAEGVVRASTGAQPVDGGDLPPAASVADHLLDRLQAAATSGPIEHRMLCLYAEAFALAARGDRRGSMRRISYAAELDRRHRFSLGAAELVAHGAAHTTDLFELGLQLAWKSPAAKTVFRWSEIARRSACLVHPLQPPDDPEIAALVTQVRSLSQRALKADSAQRPELVRSHARAARRLRSAERTRYGLGNGTELDIPSLSQVREALGERRMISMVTMDGRLCFQHITAKRARRGDLGPASWWSDRFTRCRRLLDAAARQVPGATAQAAELVDELTKALAPLDTERASASETVLIPPPALFDAPWGATERLGENPLTIAPSAQFWVTSLAERRHPTRGSLKVLCVAGPGLAHGETEALAVAGNYDQGKATTLVGPSATTAAVVEALEDAELAHLVCHGVHRPGNALFSSLSLADGPLAVLDVERLKAVPATMVLSACMAASVDHVGGQALLGMTTSFLRIGCKAVMAGNGLVEDDSLTVDYMGRLHKHLSDSTPLASAIVEARPTDPAERLTVAAGFHCYGASGGA